MELSDDQRAEKTQAIRRRYSTDHVERVERMAVEITLGMAKADSLVVATPEDSALWDRLVAEIEDGVEEIGRAVDREDVLAAKLTLIGRSRPVSRARPWLAHAALPPHRDGRPLRPRWHPHRCASTTASVRLDAGSRLALA